MASRFSSARGVRTRRPAAWSPSATASTRTAAITCGRPSSSSPAASRCTRSTCAAAASRTASASTSRGSRLLNDVGTLVALAKSREPGLPVFLLGHSAGGVISCVYTLEHQAELAGLICESFAFQVRGAGFRARRRQGAEPHRAACARAALKNEEFSRDPAGRAGDERRSAHRARGAADARPSPSWSAPTSGSSRSSR